MFPRYLVDFDRTKLQKYKTDFLVIGTGIAGLTTALNLSSTGQVTLLSKAKIEESNTKYAQGGIAAVTKEQDSPKLHKRDTLKAGANFCNPTAVDILVNQAGDKINELIQLGVKFDLNQSDLAVTKEGGHSKARVLHAGGDATGKEISSTLIEQAKGRSSIKLEASSFVVDLLTTKGSCYGAIVYNSKIEEYIIYQARAVVIATGGVGELYSFTSNPKTATGDGIAMAYRAGAEVMDLEFLQFHPTVLSLPETEPFLISEAIRGEGAILRNQDGVRFMPDYHELAELAPRDIVARAIKEEIKKQELDYVYLDLTMWEREFIKNRFPSIYQSCLTAGLNISNEYIPVRPGAHYFMGGIKTDTYGQTSIDRLFACGEAACLGVHGANRLASNSLLEGLVFANRITDKIKENKYQFLEVDVDESKNDFTITDKSLEELKFNLQQLMQDKVSIVRQEQELKQALSQVKSYLDVFNYNYTTQFDFEVQNLITLAYLIIKSALLRKESRGAHYRSNFPMTKKEWNKHIVLTRNKEWRVRKIDFE